MRRQTMASIVRDVDDRVVKKGMRLLLHWGLAPNAFALLMTTGWRTGLPRRTPVGNGLIGDTFWLIAARGEAAHYVRNLRHNPAVDAVFLKQVADELRALGGRDARAASGTVTATIRLPSEQLMAIASYALRAV